MREFERSNFSISTVRAQFPALAREHGGQRIIWTCAPGGTQVPDAVIEAMARYQRRGLSNLHGGFAASEEADRVLGQAREDARLFLHAKSAEEIHFGANTTSLSFHLSHALAREWDSGDAIVVTSLDHDSNVRPWVRAAQAKGVEVRTWNFRTADGRLHIEDLLPLLEGRVRLVAVTAASNAIGTIIPIRPVSEAAHAQGALVVVDAVHHAPHRSMDVQAMDCDVVTCSAYKFFGPHVGFQWIRGEVSERLDVDKVKPSPDEGGARFETGTVNLEGLAGFSACVAYLKSLGVGEGRSALTSSFSAIGSHEESLSALFLEGTANVPGLTVYGETRPDIDVRTPTFGITLDGWTSSALSRALAERAINTWSGHFYALGVVNQFDLAQREGLVRIGFVHYHTTEEVLRVLQALHELSRSAE